MTPAEVRNELANVKRRREALEKREREVQKATRRALRQSKGVIPLSEACELAGLHRSTAYKTYLGGRDGTGTKARN